MDEEKGTVRPWGEPCFLCQKPGTIEHVLLECCDGIFFWDVLQCTRKNYFCYTCTELNPLDWKYVQRAISFDYVNEPAQYLEFSDDYADICAREAREYFPESIAFTVEAQKSCEPERIQHVETVMNLKRF